MPFCVARRGEELPVCVEDALAVRVECNLACGPEPLRGGVPRGEGQCREMRDRCAIERIALERLLERATGRTCGSGTSDRRP